MPLTATTVFRTLTRLYHPPRTFLHYTTPLELLLATVLSAQCTDARVNRVTKDLFARYRTPDDYCRASIHDLEAAIHSCGTYRMKARYLQGICAMLLSRHAGRVPSTMAELTALPGVGRKTAAIVLYAIYGIQDGVAVDTHVMRLSRRLGLSDNNTQKKIELDLMRDLPRSAWGPFSPLLISHARAVCTAYHRRCDRCVFSKECSSSSEQGYRDLAANNGLRKHTKK